MDYSTIGLAAARAIYMLILLLTTGTALFRVLVPTPAHLDRDLRRRQNHQRLYNGQGQKRVKAQ